MTETLTKEELTELLLGALDAAVVDMQEEVESEEATMLDEDGNMLSTHPEYCSHCAVIQSIDEVILNTLAAEGKLETNSVQNMLTLSKIRSMYLTTV